MLECQDLYGILVDHGIEFYAGVPDSLLKEFMAFLKENHAAAKNITAANEGGAIALAVGHYLATGKPGMVYMQNSGLGNAVNPLVSLTDAAVYRIPILLMIGWRGEPGRKDEPQHLTQGRITTELLEVLGVQYAILPAEPEPAASVVKQAVAYLKKEERCFALLVRKGTFAAYEGGGTALMPACMGREEAIETVCTTASAGDVFVTTTGKTSREIYELRNRLGHSHDADFLMIGSMGHCSQIAAGIALQNPERRVLCLDGDGAAIMHMGGLAIVGSLPLGNFFHLLLNNGAHDSVGGQETAGRKIDFCGVAKSCGYLYVRRVETREELINCLSSARKHQGPAFIEIVIRMGARGELGRPERTPLQRKQQFMNFLQGE